MKTSGRTVVALVALLAITRIEPALAQSWTGPFVGLTAGYGSGQSNQTDSGIPAALPPNLGDGSYRVGGGLAGATLGFNWQQGAWVFGLEGDYSWAGIDGRSPVCGAATATPHPCGTRLDALGTLRGRVGYAVGPSGSVLPYLTGGLAVGNVQGWDKMRIICFAARPTSPVLPAPITAAASSTAAVKRNRSRRSGDGWASPSTA